MMSKRLGTSGTVVSAAKNRLLRQQSAILAHLANPVAYERPGARGNGLAGLNGDNLRTLGRLILAKRMGKIEAMLPASCRCASVHAPWLVRKFAETCVPKSLSRFDNARQFHDFVIAKEGTDIAPNYLGDLVRFEYLAATVMSLARGDGSSRAPQPPTLSTVEVRVPTHVRFFETKFDLTSALGDRPPSTLERGDARVVAVVPGATAPRAYWLDADIASFLHGVGEWTLLPAADQSRAAELIGSLAGRGLLEMRSCDSVL